MIFVAEESLFPGAQRIIDVLRDFLKVVATLVRRQAVAEPADEPVDGQLCQLAGEIPERHINHPSHRAGEIGVAVQAQELLPQQLSVVRVGADEHIPVVGLNLPGNICADAEAPAFSIAVSRQPQETDREVDLDISYFHDSQRQGLGELILRAQSAK